MTRGPTIFKPVRTGTEFAQAIGTVPSADIQAGNAGERTIDGKQEQVLYRPNPGAALSAIG